MTTGRKLKKTLAKRTTKTDSAKKLAVEAARIAQDGNIEDLLVLDLRQISPVTDYFVIGSGTSDRQIRSVAEDIRLYGKSIGQPVWHVAGMDTGDWIVLDFVDVVVHLFELRLREYYDLELIWGEASKVRWQKRRSASAQSDKNQGE